MSKQKNKLKGHKLQEGNPLSLWNQPGEPPAFLMPDQDSAYNDIVQAGNRAYYDEFGNQILSNYASSVGQAVAGIGQAINRYVDQTDINNSSRPDLADSYIGDSWSNILWNGDRRSRAFNAVNSQVNDVSDIRNNYNLENAYEAPQLGVTYTGAKAKVWGDVLQDAGTGASLGSTFGPLGTAIGTGAGVLSGLARGFIGDLTNRKNAADINAAVKSANVYQNNQFNNTAINNDMLSQRKWMMSPQYAHYGAEGGSLEELNGVTKFNYEVGKEYDVDENTYNKLLQLGYRIQVL